LSDADPIRSDQGAYESLCAYTLGRGDVEFVHQHVVDAYAAQRADEHTKPIALTFALVGLYLHVEKGWTGRQVQRAHEQLARRKQVWPTLLLPGDRGSTTVVDVVGVPEGPERDGAIHAWCRSVWEAFAGNRAAVAELLTQRGIL
jgi:Family of unknown function (DUF5946)